MTKFARMDRCAVKKQVVFSSAALPGQQDPQGQAESYDPCR